MLRCCSVFIPSVLVALCGCSPQPAETLDRLNVIPPDQFAPLGAMREELICGDYQVRIYLGANETDGECFEILHKTRRVFCAIGWRISVCGSDSASPDAIGRDITGDGVPDLAVWDWSGGAHCCMTVHLFELGSRLRHIQSIDCGHGDGGEFVDLDDDSGMELKVCDWTFAYWNASFAESPDPQVVLKFRDGAYKIAVDLMRKPAPTADGLHAEAEDLRKSTEWASSVPPSLWGRMLDLIYSGNADSASHLCHQAWASEKLSRQKFVLHFLSQLSTSPYWSDVARMNGGEEELYSAFELTNSN